jgi:hypothetical protein
MPGKLKLPPAQMLKRIRAQTRARVARHRAHPEAPGSVTCNVTCNATSASLDARTHEGADARSTAFLVTPLPSVKEEEGISDFERVRGVLEPVRGYVHNERHLRRLAERFPDVDLVLEAEGMARWVNGNRRGNGCTEAFMTNWVKKSHAPRKPSSVLVGVLEQIATSPVAGPSTWH